MNQGHKPRLCLILLNVNLKFPVSNHNIATSTRHTELNMNLVGIEKAKRHKAICSNVSNLAAFNMYAKVVELYY